MAWQVPGAGWAMGSPSALWQDISVYSWIAPDVQVTPVAQAQALHVAGGA